MRRIRILVVDDSVVARRVISDILSEEEDFEVVGTAPNGRLALTKIEILDPDLVTLDIDMPELDGIETLSAIRRSHSKTQVIMVSNHTQRGASITVEALFLGASDYVTKAARSSSRESARAYLREQLVPKVRALSFPATTARIKAPATTQVAAARRKAAPAVKIVVIGASTGGPNALTAVLGALPANFPVPVLIVQHLPKNFTKFFAQRLDAACALTVREATDGTRIAAGTIWIAPGDLHLEARSTARGIVLATTDDPLVNSCRPAADVLFRTAATCYGAATLAVVLTGMGQDGLDGCRRIREVGGQIIVQDKATSVVWGMPGQVTEAGLAEAVLPISDVGEEVIRRVGETAQMSQSDVPELPKSIGPLDFDYIRALVRKESSIVLDGSKTYLVTSRLLPLARAQGFDTVGALISRLQTTSFGELHSLAIEAIATTETSFFRDHHPFVALRDMIIPELVKRRSRSSHSLSIWSAACASGQEPHSVAMILRDRFADLNGWNLQLMASDFSRGMLDRAREGLYSQLEINRGLPAPYLVRFFSQQEDKWLLAPEVRRMFRFFHQNLTSEWTLATQVDIVMMRNVLIYFDVETRRELLRRVRRILKPGGYLLLGSAETTLNLDDFFTRVLVGRAVFYQDTKGGDR